jgi:hypothetical protein
MNHSKWTPWFSLLLAGAASAQMVNASRPPPEFATHTSGAHQVIAPPPVGYPQDVAYVARLNSQAKLLRHTPSATNSPELLARLDRLDAHASMLAKHEAFMREVQVSLTTIRNGADDLSELASQVLAAELAGDLTAKTTPARIAAASRLGLVSQRFSRSASEFWGPTGLRAEAVFLLVQDMGVLEETVKALELGNADLKIAAPRDALQKERAMGFAASLAKLRPHFSTVASQLMILTQVATARFEAENELAQLSSTATRR